MELHSVTTAPRIWVALLAFCFAPIAAAEEIATVVEFRDGTLLYDGKIDAANVRKFMALYEGAAVKPPSFTIRSMGGSGTAGLDFAEFVYAHGLSVRVWDYCHSSCSNFILVAAKQKVLASDAVVAWHSSPLQQAWQIGDRKETLRCTSAETCAAEVSRATGEAHKCERTDPCPDERAYMEREMLATLESQIRRTKALYAATGVDPSVTTYGVDRDCYCEWTFHVEDMRKFNIKNLVEEERRKMSDYSLEGHKQARALAKRVRTFKLP
jgi:hypothetical protein